jgi:predicted regulator of Ras-like GTPase activity (Roadblock/LC7/MglB family)
MANQPLSALRDVSGVHGSFVVSATGALIVRDLPAVFDDNVLSEVGQRIVNLHDALSTGGQDLDSCVMRFSEHKLHLRRVSNGFLCVLTTNAVNTPALKMALTLTARRVDPAISAIPPAALSSGPPPESSRKPRFFRGQQSE